MLCAAFCKTLIISYDEAVSGLSGTTFNTWKCCKCFELSEIKFKPVQYTFNIPIMAWSPSMVVEILELQ